MRTISIVLVLMAEVLLASSLGRAANAADAAPLTIVVAEPLVPSVERALVQLETALRGKGVAARRAASLPGDKQTVVAIGIAGKSPLVDRLCKAAAIEVAKTPESLCVRKVDVAGQAVWLHAGSDDRGLMYALLETARSIELAPKGGDLWKSIVPASESPALRWRSITIHLLNADVEREWYFSDQHWDSYFAMLARCRFNNFSLTFTDQTNYLNPPYAHLVDVPGFPDVQVAGVGRAERQRNLGMLRKIAQAAHEHGVDFTLSIWTQLPVVKYKGASGAVTGLPQGPQAAAYCAAGLKQILAEVPEIDAIQFRMNAEAGVAESEQAAFYRPLFESIQKCGRPLRVDLRYKGLRPETTQAAIDLGLDVTVTTKLWCEHLGLPYHPTVADSHYRESRYSYGTMLANPHPYRVGFRLWNVGSQRVLLWGDPAYAARFAESCLAAEGERCEVFALLNDKGFGNAPGAWRLFADPSYEHFTWEFERYWFFNLAYGRMTYNPHTPAEVWQRELRHRFGPAAAAIETAYRQASQVLPLVTATHLPSASEWIWWPELDTGDRLHEYMRTQPSDTAQFYPVRTWSRSERWRAEPWDPNPGYAELAVAGHVGPQWTPPEVARKLQTLATETRAALSEAQRLGGEQRSPELRATLVDLGVLAALAEYHAEKKLAATDLAFFELTKEGGRLPRSLEHARTALAAWQKIVDLTDGVYAKNLVFGNSPEDRRPQGHHHTGHWKDRLPELRDDVTYLEKLMKGRQDLTAPVRTFPGETDEAVAPVIVHEPIQTADSSKDLAIAARVTTPANVRELVLHFRHMDQTADWHERPCERGSDGVWRATISHNEILARWDLQYYLEVRPESGRARLWPSWEVGQPYFIVQVQPGAK